MTLITGWLEPLLDRISENASTVVVPVIDNIDEETLKFEAHKLLIGIGIFNFNLEFTWKSIPRTPARFPGMKMTEPIRCVEKLMYSMAMLYTNKGGYLVISY